MSGETCPEMAHCKDRREMDKDFKEKIEATMTDLVVAKGKQDLQHGEITRRLDSITSNQEAIIRVLGDVKGLLVDVDRLRKELDNDRERVAAQLKELFQRMLRAEDTKADEDDLKNSLGKIETSIAKVETKIDAMEERGISWLWQVLMIGGAAGLGALFGWLFSHI